MSRLVLLLAAFALAACDVFLAQPSPEESGGPSVAVPACQFLDAAAVERIVGVPVDRAEQHLSAMPIAGFVDCVYFDADDDVVAWVAVRQEETDSEVADGLMDDLVSALAEDVEAADVSAEIGQPGRAYRYCLAAGDCRVATAVLVAPNFFVASVPEGPAAREMSIALARGVASR